MLLDSDFWHELAHQFRSLQDSDGILYAHWKSEAGSAFEWSVKATKVVYGSDSVRAEFEVLAARGGARVDNPNNRDLLSAWFDALNKETPTTEFGSSAETLKNGKPARTWGKIHRICDASETFCHKLEYRALEAEALARTEQKRKSDPKQWPYLVQQWESHKSIKKAFAGPHEEIPEEFLRALLSVQHGLRPVDVTPNQIQVALQELASHYASVEMVPLETAKATDDPEEASPLSELRSLGMTTDISETVATKIKGQLLIIDGHLRQGVYRDASLKGSFVRQHLYDAYHVIAHAVVSADTPDDVLENMIPAMVQAFKVKEHWLPVMDYETLKASLQGAVTEWKGKRLLMRTQAVPMTEVAPVVRVEAQESNQSSLPAAVPENNSPNELWKQLNALRLDCELTYEEVAAGIGIDATNVSRHMTGKAVPSRNNRKHYGTLFSKLLKYEVVISKTQVKRSQNAGPGHGDAGK